MTTSARKFTGWGIAGVLFAFAILFFFQTRDPMILIFGAIGGLMALASTRVLPSRGRADVRVKCIACGGLNLEDAKFCSQCGRAI